MPAPVTRSPSTPSPSTPSPSGRSPVGNRYADAPRRADHTIDQDWRSYTDEEHDRWRRLYARSMNVLEDRACSAWLSAAKTLRLTSHAIPDMEHLSARLAATTGWRVVPVAGLVPDEVFFEHLANRRFPAGAFIRPEKDLDYLQEPDIFHDIFGHVPLLADPAYAAFIEGYGKGGRRAMALGMLPQLARLYWYTVEFGLVRDAAGLRIFGAGIMSSVAECRFALDDPSPHHIAFDAERIMRTRYAIDDFQRTYFVINSFEALLEACYRDLLPIYERLKTLGDLEPDATLESDSIVRRGTQAHFIGRASAPE